MLYFIFLIKAGILIYWLANLFVYKLSSKIHHWWSFWNFLKKKKTNYEKLSLINQINSISVSLHQLLKPKSSLDNCLHISFRYSKELTMYWHHTCFKKVIFCNFFHFAFSPYIHCSPNFQQGSMHLKSF